MELSLRFNPNVLSNIGFLPSGALFVHRSVDGGDDMWDFDLCDYLVAPDVERLRFVLAPGRSSPLSDTELLELLAAKFESGHPLVEWLHAAGFKTVHRSDQDGASRPAVLDDKIRARLWTATVAADAVRNAAP